MRMPLGLSDDDFTGEPHLPGCLGYPGFGDCDCPPEQSVNDWLREEEERLHAEAREMRRERLKREANGLRALADRKTRPVVFCYSCRLEMPRADWPTHHLSDDHRALLNGPQCPDCGVTRGNPHDALCRAGMIRSGYA